MLRCIAILLVIVGSCASPVLAQEPLPGTQPLTFVGDISSHLLDGAHQFVDREIERSPSRRQRLWDLPESSIEKMRARFAVALGAVDSSKLPPSLEFMRRDRMSSLVGRFGPIEVHDVEWNVAESVEPGIRLVGSGLYLRPATMSSNLYAIVLGDVEEFPEATAERDARILAQNGCHVFMPRMVSRETFASRTNAGARETKLDHREFIYRQAFEAGRNVVGYEVSSLRALVRWIKAQAMTSPPRIAIFGQGEGGYLALATAALEPQIEVAVVVDAFGSHDRLWEEHPELNMWGRIAEFGDAEIARLILPRTLVIDSQDKPDPVRPRELAKQAAPVAPRIPTAADARTEAARIRGANDSTVVMVTTPVRRGPIMYGSSTEFVLRKFGQFGERSSSVGAVDYINTDAIDIASAHSRQQQLVDNMSAYTQALIREAEYTRNAKLVELIKANGRDAEKWPTTITDWRKEFYDEVIGRFPYDLKPFNAQTRRIYDEPKYTGYEVTLDVFDEVIAYGVLLVPKDIKPGERRPVVVCQHGLEGRPQDTIENNAGERYYHRFAAKLCERGFVTFSPQNLYIFKDRFRELQRKLNPLKKTLFSLIVPQHEQICRWLKTQPFVAGDRIAFYGLSYGGKSAMRIPPLVEHYGPVICSGDFNDWVRKTTSIRDPFSYVGTGEYEIWEWNLASTFNYAEMAALIAPRPFMVERGHRDGVGIDEWVDYEYAKVRRLYADLKIPERTEIEHFDGPHEIHAVETFRFLHRHLNWPE